MEGHIYRDTYYFEESFTVPWPAGQLRVAITPVASSRSRPNHPPSSSHSHSGRNRSSHHGSEHRSHKRRSDRTDHSGLELVSELDDRSVRGQLPNNEIYQAAGSEPSPRMELEGSGGGWDPLQTSSGMEHVPELCDDSSAGPAYHQSRSGSRTSNMGELYGSEPPIAELESAPGMWGMGSHNVYEGGSDKVLCTPTVPPSVHGHARARSVQQPYVRTAPPTMAPPMDTYASHTPMVYGSGATSLEHTFFEAEGDYPL
nr:uncharacterized protein CI109_003582 [Kwoniella shandongensis]KAA5527929.1 hypothetical protein CI109_003582 [Kwoniella shandongensis]